MPPNRQIGSASSIEEILLSDINKQLERLIQVTSGGGGGTGTVTSVTGTTDRITITGTPTIAPIVNIAATYVGQTSITTLGTISTGTWNATVIGPAKGGTGIANNAASTLTISGNFATTITITGITTVTLPTSGTLVNSTQAWLSASGTTLTGNNTIVQAGFNTSFTGIGTVTFSPTSGFEGINVGSFAGTPTMSNGGLAYNSTGNTLLARINAVNGIVAHISAATIGRIPFWTSTSGRLTDSANLTFSTNRILGTTLYLTLSAGTATAGTCPLLMTSGTVLGTAISGGIEYNNTFHMTNSDATRRHVVLAPNNTKVTAGAPYTNDGYVVVNIGGTDFKMMTTA